MQFWAGHTFGGNPVSCAVGEAAVRYLLDHDLIGNAERVGNYLAARLEDLATRQPAIAEIRGIGMLRGWPSGSRSGRRSTTRRGVAGC